MFYWNNYKSETQFQMSLQKLILHYDKAELTSPLRETSR